MREMLASQQGLTGKTPLDWSGGILNHCKLIPDLASALPPI